MSSATDPKPLSAPAERPLPSDRFDAAQARLQAAAAASTPVKAKRSKNPAYHVLMLIDGRYERLTSDPSMEPRVGTFVVILADAWTEITRSVKPRQEYEEVWE